MKKLLGLILGLTILLVACGGKVDGTYKNSDISITANSESGNATLHINSLESDGFLGMGASDGDMDGTVNKDKKTMTFNTEDGDIKLNYKVSGNKLIIDNPIDYGNKEDKVELTKQ